MAEVGVAIVGELLCVYHCVEDTGSRTAVVDTTCDDPISVSRGCR